MLNVAEVMALVTEYHDPEEILVCDGYFWCTVTVSLNVAEVIALDTDPHLGAVTFPLYSNNLVECCRGHSARHRSTPVINTSTVQ